MSNWKWDDNNSSSSCFWFITVDPVDNLFKILQKKKSDVTDLKSIVAFFSCVFNINLWLCLTYQRSYFSHRKGCRLLAVGGPCNTAWCPAGGVFSSFITGKGNGESNISGLSTKKYRKPAWCSITYTALSWDEATWHTFPAIFNDSALYFAPHIVQSPQQWRKHVVPFSWTKPHEVSFTSQSLNTSSDMIYVFFVVYVILPDTVMFTIYYVHLKYVARILSYMPADNTVNFSLLSSANLNLMPGDCFWCRASEPGCADMGRFY